MTGAKIAQADSFLWWGLIRSHDAFFKWLMDQPGVAEVLLAFVLSQELRRFWDGTALVPLPGSLITRELAERRTDRTYLCPSPNGVPAPLLVVFEHKSAPDRETPWQVTQYLYEQVRAWMAGRKSLPKNERYRLPVMAAVVVYQGKWRWRVPLTLLGFLADGPEASQLSNVRYMFRLPDPA